MTRGNGIYDDEDGSKASHAAQETEGREVTDEDTPDVDKSSGEPTA